MRRVRNHFCVEKIETLPTKNEWYGSDRPSKIGLSFQQTKYDGKNCMVNNFASKIRLGYYTSRGYEV